LPVAAVGLAPAPETLASSNIRLTTSLKRPFASTANAKSEQQVSQCKPREHYGTHG